MPGECGLASTSASLEAKNKLLRRLVRADMRGFVGVEGESCGEGITKSPCPCVGVHSACRTSSLAEAISACPCFTVKAGWGLTRVDVCAEGITTRIGRGGRVRVVDEDGAATEEREAERWAAAEVVVMLGLGLARAEKD